MSTAKVMSRSVTVGMPVIVGTILSLIGGGVIVAVQVIPGISQQVQSGVIVGDVFFLGIGITPLVGHQFYAALRLPPWAANLASAVMAAVTLASTTIHMPSLAHRIVAAFLAVATGLGFEPATPVALAPVEPVALEPIKPRAPGTPGPLTAVHSPAPPNYTATEQEPFND